MKIAKRIIEKFNTLNEEFYFITMDNKKAVAISKKINKLSDGVSARDDYDAGESILIISLSDGPNEKKLKSKVEDILKKEGFDSPF